MKEVARREWDWVSAGLLFLMLQTVAARLTTTEWAPNLNWTESLAALGTILGLAIGASRFRGVSVAVLVVGYSVTIVPWQLTAAAPDHLLLDRLNRLGWIIWIALNQFVNGLPVRDPLFFVSLVCVAFWFMGIGAGYALARHGRVMGSIAVAGAALLIVQAYGDYQPRGSWWLAVFLLIALVLVGRTHFLGNKGAWVETRLFVSEDSGTNILSSLFMTAAIAILIAWWIPTSSRSVERAAEIWNTYIEPVRERLSNAVTSLEGPYGRPGTDFYANSLALGQNAATGDTEVLTIRVVESPGLNMRYYWRGRTYNFYDGGLWTVSANAKLLVHPNQGDIEIPDADGRTAALFEVSSEFPEQSLMYGASPMVWTDRSSDVVAMRVAPNTYDEFSWDARRVIPSGGRYQVRAMLRNPSIVELQSATGEYPEWVSAQFLAVPEKYRSQLRELAHEITVGQDSPYDKTAAITEYLRGTIDYSTSVPPAPEGQDPVMWVLFEHKEGFCNYYASAEVLLLRSIGIPARLAVGFAQGDLDAGVYTVFRRDAHAWPEVYFTGIGWVEFEPTSSQTPLNRPAGEGEDRTTASDADAQAGSQEDDLTRIPEEVELAPPSTPLPFRLTPWGRTLMTTLPILAAAVSLVLAYRLRLAQRMPSLMIRALEAGGGTAPYWMRLWDRWNSLEPVQRAFAAVGWTLRLLGKPPALNATPAIQAEALAKVLPIARQHVEALRQELERGLFTDQLPDVGRARRAAAIVLMRGVRRRITRLLESLDGRTVYSE